jgi:hypothetical protein
MGSRATSTFDLDTWEEQPWHDQDGTKLTRATVTKTFHGDLEGESTVELLLAYTPVETSRAYAGFERIVGRLHGRSGSFVLYHAAIASKDRQSTAWSVVPDSGTGELRGIRGDGRIVIEPDGGHTFTLDYDVD